MSWEFEFTCPICNSDNNVPPIGPKKSPILIIGDKPGQQELKEGKPFVGATGGVLREELAHHGGDMRKIRITNLWLHEDNKNKDCKEYGAKQALHEAQDKKIILLIGSDTVKYFANASVEEYNGLLVQCNLIPDAIVMACVQPTTAFHGGIGEIRFAIEQFAKLLKEEKII